MLAAILPQTIDTSYHGGLASDIGGAFFHESEEIMMRRCILNRAG
jgi:hypothetical protein